MGYFHNDKLEGFAKMIFKNEVCYFGEVHDDSFRGETIMYVFKSNVFLEAYHSREGRSYELTKGVGLPFEKLFQLSSQSLAFYPCCFLDAQSFFTADIIKGDHQGNITHY